MSHDLKVNGEKEFPSTNWKEAVLSFLFQVWCGWGFEDEEEAYRPKWRISFGDITLRLRAGNERYFAYGTSPDDFPYHAVRGETINVSSKKEEVEVGLARFVKNPEIRMFVIRFSSDVNLYIWKKEKRGEYGVHAIGIEESLPIWWA